MCRLMYRRRELGATQGLGNLWEAPTLSCPELVLTCLFVCNKSQLLPLALEDGPQTYISLVPEGRVPGRHL